MTFALSLTDMMIGKDNPEILSDDYIASKEGQVGFYIPRAAPMNGKKRGAILSWALPPNRMFVNSEQVSSKILFIFTISGAWATQTTASQRILGFQTADQQRNNDFPAALL